MPVQVSLAQNKFKVSLDDLMASCLKIKRRLDWPAATVHANLPSSGTTGPRLKTS